MLIDGRRKKYGVCTRTERFNKGKDKGSFQPYKAAACVLWRRNSDRLTDILSDKERARNKYVGDAYDYHYAPLLPACALRKTRTAARKGAEKHHRRMLPSPERAPVYDK